MAETTVTDVQQETNQPRNPGLWTGLIVGALLAAPIIALFFLGDAIAGLPLVPLDVIDWAARALPGAVITFGIDTMVNIITAFNLGPVDDIAKLGEQMMGVLTLYIGMTVAAGALFFLLKGIGRNMATNLGLLLGIGFGIVLVLINASLPFEQVNGPIISAAWILLVFVGWGLALGWIYNDLTRIATTAIVDDKPQVQGINRRQFLVRLGGATATLTLVGAGLSAVFNSQGSSSTETIAASGSDASTTPPSPTVSDASVQPAPGTRPEYTPLEDHYRIDISSRPPVIDAATYSLPITGLVGNPLELTLDDIRAYETTDQIITMQCISNRIAGGLISTTRWTGVPMRDILADAEIEEDGQWLFITSADGFDEYVSIEMIMNDPSIILAYEWDGRPLLQKHGFPLRIHIPNRYGMKQPKWITGMEVVSEWGEGYWVRRGWSREALVNTVSVVDTVAADDTYEAEDGTVMVPIGGIAYASERGISRVEVSINEGEWVETQLREPLSDRSWVIWRYDWAFETGSHTFQVRCYDGNGDLQPTEERSPRPDGATGIHRIGRRL